MGPCRALRIENLLKVYSGQDKVVAVDHVDLTVDDGMLLVLLGPSGCGKTTLLRCVAGLEDAQDGTITLGDNTVLDVRRRLNLPTHKRDIGLVFQNYSLWPHMTRAPQRGVSACARVTSNALPATAGSTRCLISSSVANFAERLPSMLSGGQQQRIALARALAPQSGDHVAGRAARAISMRCCERTCGRNCGRFTASLASRGSTSPMIRPRRSHLARVSQS